MANNKNEVPATPPAEILPPVRQQVRDFRAALSEWRSRGYPLVSKSVHRKRIKVCAACPAQRYTRIGLFGRCADCGCMMWLKAWLAPIGCPRDFFPAEDIIDSATAISD